MYTFDILEKGQKVHFIGIGGVSMSGIAELLYKRGFEITGSDSRHNKYISRLEKIGIPVVIGQGPENVKDQDLFIYTDALLPTNTELLAARNSGRPVVTRGQFLGALMRNFTHAIAVSGAHGKSTTTSMISDILLQSQMDPTILIGGLLDEIGGNVMAGKDDVFVAEACEYKANILYYYPSIAIVLNIDADHLDYFKNLDDIIHTFEKYMENLGPNGTAVINVDDPNNQSLPDHVQGKVITYGMENPKAMVFAKNIHFDDQGYPIFEFTLPEGPTLHVHLQVLGRFNVRNALASMIAAHEAGASWEDAVKGVENYRPLHRRMEEVGEFMGAKVYTDYGHHPAEIQVTLEAMAEHKKGKFYCVFEPYTLSRTRSLMDEFAKAFGSCDEAVITKIMVAREVDDGSVRSEELVKKINQNGDNAVYQETYEDVADYLKTVIRPGDMILTTGCGDADQIAHLLVERNLSL